MYTKNNIHFIKVWQYNGPIRDKDSSQKMLAIPQPILMLLTSNGSFTRNSTILYNQLTDIKLIKEEKHPSTGLINSTTRKYQREVWLTQNSNKKKLFLHNHKDILITIFLY
uniref:Uncharacterized protein n=1 Tax=Dermonema virens TaxID=1077399 RepID=A0A1G4NRK3_9FLOR|nr:Hypothetical protein ORF_7 [Dermonema virens]SCW21293.1 Hypothetical protein ORF_7 [Dermonema virens]